MLPYPHSTAEGVTGTNTLNFREPHCPVRVTRSRSASVRSPRRLFTITTYKMSIKANNIWQCLKYFSGTDVVESVFN